MAKNIMKVIANGGYNWKYTTVGGMTRVNIESGEDIAHLNELDQKLWTVLSCPVKGLEFDEKTLAMMDSDNDGRIRVHEVVAASQWLTKVLKNMDQLTAGSDKVNFSEIREETDEGKEVLNSARVILKELGLEQEEISLANVADYMGIYEEKCKAEYTAENTTPYELPYGEISDDAEAAVNALRAKVADYFMRCKLAKFDEDATAVLDVQVDKIAAISAANLSDNMAEISTYPLARPVKDCLLPLNGGINPAWQAAFDTLKAKVLDTEFAGKESITEDEWNTVLAKIDGYSAWKADGAKAMDEAIAAKLSEHAAAIAPVEKLVRLLRDFYKLLHNYVVFKDFYSRKTGNEAIFQAGKLYIDQRCCELCIKVTDMPKATTTAGLSGMYLLFCTCTSKVKNETMNIVVAVTDGDIDDLSVGKNAIFYDRTGQDWDATVTKIVDNPISVRQAFLSPYKKFGKWVNDKITKNAAEKESKGFENMTAKADTASTSLTVKPADGAAPAAAAAEKKPPFDIAKFAGIFAAIGLAVGAIGAALAALGGFVVAKWYNILLILLFVVVVVSGPSMLLAYLKLRKRNLGPVLNANGWAINSMVKVNIPFGNTLTSIAKYPKIVMNDPFAEKKTPWWKKLLWWLLVIVLLAGAATLYLHKKQGRWFWQPKPVETEVVEEATAQPADTSTEGTADAAAIAEQTPADAPAETPAEAPAQTPAE